MKLKYVTITVITCLLTLGLLVIHSDRHVEGLGFTIGAAVPDKKANITAKDRSQQIDRWIDELSRQNDFTDWKKATRHEYPLGPGTHSWVVLLELQGEEIGYLVVGATELGGLALLEYGSGPFPLFGMNTLYHSLVQHGLISSSNPLHHTKGLEQSGLEVSRIYGSAFQAVWKITSPNSTLIYWDASTGEQLPIGENLEPEFSKSLVTSLSTSQLQPKQLSSVRLTTAFDPYEHFPWLVSDPVEFQSKQDFIHDFNRGVRFVFIAECFEDALLYAYPIRGYHVWDQTVYIAMGEESIRWIPYDEVVSLGHIYE